MGSYETVIGLEVHARLKTQSKLFCSCSTSVRSGPNENICPGCAAMPGALPVLNAKAVELAAKAGLALGCTVNEYSIFARKSYFYPDLPAGYQTSQFSPPICQGGEVEITVDGRKKKIRLNRIHIEDDAGKSIHAGADKSLVDLNRGGMPLIEIVSEPDLRGPEEAVAYLRALRAILVYLDVCDGNMEEGSLRCDANVSLRPKGESCFGVRSEIKNLNSFRNVQRAIEYEISRHRDCLDDGEPLYQETRLYDSVKNITLAMRGKEHAEDYRYFPNPDLPPVHVPPEFLEGLRQNLPELPAARLARFIGEYRLPEQDADLLTAERELADYFEQAVKAYPQPKKIANLMRGELMRELNQRVVGLDACALKPEGLAKLASIVDSGLISAKIAHDVFAELFERNGDPETLVKSKGLAQISDTGAIDAAVEAAVTENPAEAERCRAGEKKLLAFLVGQVMRKTKGQANPALVNELLAKKLGLQ